MTVAVGYGQYALNLASKNADWISDTVKAILLLNTYTPDQDNDVWVDDISAYEASGGGYARITLGTKTRVYDGASNTLTLSCAGPITFPGLTLTGVRYMAIMHDSGSDATSPLVAYMDFESDQAPTAQDLKVSVPVAGLYTMITS